MADLNGNDKGIRFDHTRTEKARCGDRHEFFLVSLPDGATSDDALAAAYENGFRAYSSYEMDEPYARIFQNTTIDFSGETVECRPSYELCITYPKAG